MTKHHSLNSLLSSHRLFVILGPYGSGKTELAIGLARQLAKSGRRTALADLDIINPYFRSREKEGLLQEAGIQLVAPPKATWAADLPAIPPELWSLIQDDSLAGVIDVGGDKGAIVLASFAEAIRKAGTAVWYVVNQARLSTQSVDEAKKQLQLIEAQAKLSVNGLIHNTHLLGDTSAELIHEGAAPTYELARQTGLPVVFHGVQTSLADQVHLNEPILPLALVMKRPWE